MERIDNKLLSLWIIKIGFEIIDDVISPICGIDHVIADLYLADVWVYASDQKEVDKIFREIRKKYKLNKYTLLDDSIPIAMIALEILLEGEYQ